MGHLRSRRQGRTEERNRRSLARCDASQGVVCFSRSVDLERKSRWNHPALESKRYRVGLAQLELADGSISDLLTPKPPGEKTVFGENAHLAIPQRTPGELTEEEERELDELLNDDD